MASFAELVASRKAWIAGVLEPWCRAAARSELLKAEPEWVDIAGKVDPEATLWRWAWSRFPDLVHESLGIEETSAVEVRLRDGRVVRGFPDGRQSRRGQLMLLAESEFGRFHEAGPFSIDDIAAVHKTAI
jgi:hypothetical protein